MRELNKIRYSIMHNALDADYGIQLNAKTDLGARREARKIAKAEGLKGYSITFFRESDGCRGTLDA
jgi:hypothetical protein